MKKINKGNTPSYGSSRNGHLEIVKYLLKNGANIEEKNVEGFTSVMWTLLTLSFRYCKIF